MYSLMYYSTNLPKEVMGYPDFLYPSEIKESFITSHQVLDFLRSYADHFDLRPHIKLQHEVIRVRPRVDDWEVSADVMSVISCCCLAVVVIVVNVNSFRLYSYIVIKLVTLHINTICTLSLFLICAGLCLGSRQRHLRSGLL